MSGIYIHIPFCKQACHYCDFHFSTKTTSKKQMLQALIKELEIRKNEFKGQPVTSIYFGGGTPSVLSVNEIKELIAAVAANHLVAPAAEVTLEANPDDLSEHYLAALSQTKVNRLSLGVQSFNAQALSFMNRAHNAAQALEALTWVGRYFPNYSLDLIYGIPAHLEPNGAGLENSKGSSNISSQSMWQQDLETALGFNPPHISTYALTVEPKTVLASQIAKGTIAPLAEDKAAQEYKYLKETLQKAGYEHYEFSNFAKSGMHAVNNTAYWEGKSYMGIGPSAHSYDGNSRSWNVANNPKYLKALAIGMLPATKEILSLTERYNEYIMTGLRTAKGVSLPAVKALFGASYEGYLIREAAAKIQEGSLVLEGSQTLKVASEAQFLTDGLAAHLFYIDL